MTSLFGKKGKGGLRDDVTLVPYDVIVWEKRKNFVMKSLRSPIVTETAVKQTKTMLE